MINLDYLFCRLAVAILICCTPLSLSVWAGDLIPATSQISTIKSKADLCQYLLAGINAIPTPSGEEHLLSRFFSTWGLMLHNSSAGGTSRMNEYESIRSLDWSAGIIKDRPTQMVEERLKKAQEVQFYAMFVRASLGGQDLTLARVLNSIGVINSALHSHFFFASTSPTSRSTGQIDQDLFAASLDHAPFGYEVENGLDEIQKTWPTLSLETRLNFLKWVGRIFSENVTCYHTCKIVFELRDATGQPTQTVAQSLPNLIETLNNYLLEHQNQGSTEVLTRNYYRHIAFKVLKPYGIEPKDEFEDLVPEVPKVPDVPEIGFLAKISARLKPKLF